ncbi:hypothetical protein LRP50_08285 [Enterovibrio sp. ZSDZ42]|uniref:Uncharacterized protein n=1 Tax=Enterovibrio gelatinilyticus TaxID=2899819 RepID=A0ABT5QZD1_9GAMM|nr:hypothetical protein [Enterovibrio sp. ZSDZ42]
MMETPEQDMNVINKALMSGFDEAVDDFIAARASEGANMKALIEQRLDGIAAEVVKVRAKMPEILNWQLERLITKLEEAKIELDANRVEQVKYSSVYFTERENAAIRGLHKVT